MRKISNFLCSFLIIAAIFILILPYLIGSVRANETIKIALGEWEPYCSQKLKHGGVLARIITESFVLEGKKTQVSFFPWKRSLHFIDQGKFDISGGWIKTEERSQKFLFSNQVFIGKIVFFHLKNFHFQWNSISDLKEYKIATINGYAYSKALSKAIKSGELTVSYTNKEKQLFNMLLLKRVQIVPSNLDVGYATIHKYFPNKISDFKVNSNPIYEAKYFIISSNKKKSNYKLISTF